VSIDDESEDEVIEVWREVSDDEGVRLMCNDDVSEWSDR
jgi:hypothetical protein